MIVKYGCLIRGWWATINVFVLSAYVALKRQETTGKVNTCVFFKKKKSPLRFVGFFSFHRFSKTFGTLLKLNQSLAFPLRPQEKTENSQRQILGEKIKKGKGEEKKVLGQHKHLSRQSYLMIGFKKKEKK
eukprot:TRINITY_DN7869_c3_g1_i1.p1 TRINITY_DN7869_c3_g1~~TRINITY_DN7869_c3_g1_i1.p1  ORF type:complete len:130 (-),score=9.87 TRINITY_DN7869_c3_g1_i1:403-792(-)